VGSGLSEFGITKGKAAQRPHLMRSAGTTLSKGSKSLGHQVADASDNISQLQCRWWAAPGIGANHDGRFGTGPNHSDVPCCVFTVITGLVADHPILWKAGPQSVAASLAAN